MKFLLWLTIMLAAIFSDQFYTNAEGDGDKKGGDSMNFKINLRCIYNPTTGKYTVHQSKDDEKGGEKGGDKGKEGGKRQLQNPFEKHPGYEKNFKGYSTRQSKEQYLQKGFSLLPKNQNDKQIKNDFYYNGDKRLFGDLILGIGQAFDGLINGFGIPYGTRSPDNVISNLCYLGLIHKYSGGK